MSAGDRPTCWIVAGPNGAGKTTFALEYLPSVAGCRHFVNADLIVSEDIHRTRSGTDLVRVLDASEEWLVGSLIHKFGAGDETG